MNSSSSIRSVFLPCKVKLLKKVKLFTWQVLRRRINMLDVLRMLCSLMSLKCCLFFEGTTKDFDHFFTFLLVWFGIVYLNSLASKVLD